MVKSFNDENKFEAKERTKTFGKRIFRRSKSFSISKVDSCNEHKIKEYFALVNNLIVTEECINVNKKLKECIEDLGKRITRNHIAISDCEQRLMGLERRSINGHLIWKITNISDKLKYAVNGIQSSHYSPIFYSSIYGYRLCARLYLNGDGAGRNTHLSIFVSILKGEYDSILKWPFQQKITLILMDQSGEGKHIVDAFRPDPKSESFQRPTNDMNIASGIPKFCELSTVYCPEKGYVLDDTMFFKIIIDTNGLES